MYSSADFSVTPRPIYKADGRKLPDVYSNPPELRTALQQGLGTFPLFNFWGPASSIVSSRWIADAAARVHEIHRPTLSLVYLPHLDYALQKVGPAHESIPAAVAEIDTVVGNLVDYFEQQGVQSMIVSEYGIDEVDDAVHVNRALREDGAVRVRVEEGLELLDAGASEAFAVADHQIAHVYVSDPDRIPHFEKLCGDLPGVEQVIRREDQAAAGIGHERSGELVLVAEQRRWFSYDYWLDDSRAPDFARTVDIHRKPGYDPLELFMDPTIGIPKLKLGLKLARKSLGFRTLFDVIPLDTRLVRGSHGRVVHDEALQPLLITPEPGGDGPDELPCTAVRDVILEHLFGRS
jgi:predicted AlkP superfamily pyrophosphatase or phosphodiesterase